MVTRLAAAGILRFMERRREDLRAADFRLAEALFLELLRAGALRAATFFLEPADLRELADLRAGVRFPPRVFLAGVFRPPLEPPRDDFLAAAMM